MAVVRKSALVGYSAEQMFALVDTVENYPHFLPWCGEVSVLQRSETSLVATLHINFHGVQHSFTTENTNSAPTLMKMKLISGPFKHLDGTWVFKSLRDNACKIEFDLHYEFSSKILEHLIGPVFNKIANSFVDAFCRRAESVYEKK
ncbi:MAG: putative oligoketide cyclase/lipid transport protein [Solimicrobium sp.]|jgi:ribosome-associated toxin RatA of RatAB toxin-antitoxin module|nr:putative oligoketide cyclase/lipid transport protein [Solimicrobium sp.]